ncbi:hypothetical protein N9748_00275 [bacterium]|jgi:hypothetical protein|nr:hypothetical protein [bacterium]
MSALKAAYLMSKQEIFKRMFLIFLPRMFLFLSSRGLCNIKRRDVCLASFGFACGTGDLVLTVGGLADACMKEGRIKNVSRIS